MSDVSISYLLTYSADLIGRVANDETPPFRPQLPPVNTQDHQRLVSLITDCWAQDEGARPNIAAVRTRFATFNKGKYVRM